MTEHLHHQDYGDFEGKNDRHFIEPDLFATLGALGVAAISGGFSYAAAKSSREAKHATEDHKARNAAMSEARVAKEAAQESVNDALLDAVEEIGYAMIRNGTAHGELTARLGALSTARRDANKEINVATKRIQEVDK